MRLWTPLIAAILAVSGTAWAQDESNPLDRLEKTLDRLEKALDRKPDKPAQDDRVAQILKRLEAFVNRLDRVVGKLEGQTSQTRVVLKDQVYTYKIPIQSYTQSQIVPSKPIDPGFRFWYEFEKGVGGDYCPMCHRRYEQPRK